MSRSTVSVVDRASLSTRSSRALLLGAGLSGALAATLCAGLPSRAHAYCRTTTVAPTDQQVRTQECVTEGYPLYWPDLTIRYGFNPNRASRDLDEDTVREVFAESFAEWADVDCTDGSPGFEFIEEEDPISEFEPEHTLGGNNHNAMLFRPAAEWTEDRQGNEYPRDAYALTGVWYDTRSGRLLGADMEINEGRGPYAVCPRSGCAVGQVDLANVVTHEIGHMLGFAHSEVEDATMYYMAPPGELDKRSLEQDDADAMCAVYSPSAVLAREPKEEKSCSVRPGASQGPGMVLWGLGVVGLAVSLRRKKRG